MSTFIMFAVPIFLLFSCLSCTQSLLKLSFVYFYQAVYHYFLTGFGQFFFLKALFKLRQSL